MPLPSDSDTNLAQLMQWLRDPKAPSDAVNLREELAYLLFYGDPTWADYEDSTTISDYLSILSYWFESGDPADSSQFLLLTTPPQPVPDQSPEELANSHSEARKALVDWFTPVVAGWKAWAKKDESGMEGSPNPSFDGTPGTQFYRYDAKNEVYLYAATADEPDDKNWLSYDEHRYTPVAYDDNRKTNYRVDKVTGAYEIQSRATQGKWLTTAQWEAEQKSRAAAGGAAARVEEPLYTTPVYDERYQMYRRFSSVSRQYEYSDDRASIEWMAQAEAEQEFLRRTATTTSVGAPVDVSGDEEAQFVNELNVAFKGLAAALEEELRQNR